MNERLIAKAEEAEERERDAATRRLHPERGRSVEERLWSVRAKAFREAAALAREYEKLRTPEGEGRMGWSDQLAALGTDSLDAAWAEAEAALPEGWRLHLTRRPEGSVVATASNRDGESAASYAQPTPIAALRALTEKLLTAEVEG